MISRMREAFLYAELRLGDRADLFSRIPMDTTERAKIPKMLFQNLSYRDSGQILLSVQIGLLSRQEAMQVRAMQLYYC